jgi:hypothetical protein
MYSILLAKNKKGAFTEQGMVAYSDKQRVKKNLTAKHKGSNLLPVIYTPVRNHSV